MEQDETIWVNGIVAVRDGKPYIQFVNNKGTLTQLTVSQARQIANDIVIACSRVEADAMLFKFFQTMGLPLEGYAGLMVEFRDFRQQLDEDAAERPEGPPSIGPEGEN